MNTPTARELVAARKAQAPVDQNVDSYLDAVGGPEGRYCKFGKEGTFVTTDDGAEMDTDADYRCLFKETRVSWKKFTEGAPPEVHGGLLYDSYVLPARASLGDTDESQWQVGLSGFPSDPWCVATDGHARSLPVWNFVRHRAPGGCCSVEAL
jgi:hypothetical protein